MNDPQVPTVCYNRKWVYRQPLTDEASPSSAFSIVEEKFDSLRLGVGEAIVKTEYIFVDPFLQSTHVGEVQPACTIARVIHINDPSNRLQPNDWVEASVGWQLYAVVRVHELNRVHPPPTPHTTLPPDLLSFVGIPGRAAYFGFLEAGKPKAGDTVVVSGAGGSVGCIVAQIAKIKDCKVVGVAQNVSQCEFLRERLSIQAISMDQYRTAADLLLGLRQYCQGGIDIYVDNLGGAVTEAALQCMNVGGRVVVTSQLPRTGTPSSTLQHTLLKRLTIQGVNPLDYRDREEEFLSIMRKWMEDYLVRVDPCIIDGMENLPEAFAGLVEGKYSGAPLVVRADYQRTNVDSGPCVPRSNSPRRLQVVRGQ